MTGITVLLDSYAYNTDGTEIRLVCEKEGFKVLGWRVVESKNSQVTYKSRLTTEISANRIFSQRQRRGFIQTGNY